MTGDGLDIAIVGMSGRFPGAESVDELWDSVCAGHQGIRTLSPDELSAAGVPADVMAADDFVPVGAVLPDIGGFDAEYFGYSAREAAVIDPQHRLFLECAVHALQNAGYDPDQYDGTIGVFAAASVNEYGLRNVFPNRSLEELVGYFQTLISNDKDFLATRLAYKANLRGPAITVQTGCSSSLVAVHLAAQSLLAGDSDMVVTGGVTVRVPHCAGYRASESGVSSQDGRCRPFDRAASGTVAGNGVAVVVLKRLEDARAAGDVVHAVIRGSAVNNDGGHKTGYTAPGVAGQTAVIRAALAAAGIAPGTVGMVEAHGTATPIGDPIEVAALTDAYRGAGATGDQYCAIGSIKGNIGHLDAAAGVTGLVKAVLAVRDGRIPPSVGFIEPNPDIDFVHSPFYVSTELHDWPADGQPRRAGVSSFGIGGTNAHVIVEQAPDPAPATPGRGAEVLTLSARTATALARTAEQLANHLAADPGLPIADVAHVLQVGRPRLAHRRAVVVTGTRQAVDALRSPDSGARGHDDGPGDARLALLMPGQGTQQVGMGHDLYLDEPAYRAAVDECAELLLSRSAPDFRAPLYGIGLSEAEAAARLADPETTQIALFATQYAMAALWRARGVRPVAMLGHSFGEYVTAHLAGVLNLADALTLVTARGRLVREIPESVMLAVRMPAAELRPLLGPGLSLAADNGPDNCVAAGADAAVTALARTLTARGKYARRLPIARAFHCHMVEPVLPRFRAELARITLHEPSTPYVSTVTGDWIEPGQATDVDHWLRHMRGTVEFDSAIATLLCEPFAALLEIGPRRTLVTLTRGHLNAARRPGPQPVLVPSLPEPGGRPDAEQVAEASASLWAAGVHVDWRGARGDERRNRVALPGYPFEHRQYWIEPGRTPGPDTDHQVVAPALATTAPQGSATERAVAAVMAMVLGSPPLPPGADFFALGGHSLLAMQLAARLRDELGVEIDAADVLEQATVERIAAVVDSRRTPTPDNKSSAAASSAQERMWVLQELDRADPSYVMAMRVRLRGSLAVPALRQAIDEVVRRHEVLRTALPLVGGRVSPRVRPATASSLPTIDVTAADLGAHATRFATTPFDLAGGDLFRAELLRIAEDEHVLLLAVHHVASDYWSNGLLVNEILRCYESFAAGREAELPTSVQYSDYVDWQRSRVAADDQSLDYWARKLAGVPRLIMPTDRPRGDDPGRRGGWRPFRLSEPVSDALRAFAARERVAPFMVFLAGLDVLLSRYTGEHDLAVGTFHANRERTEYERTVGLFANTLVLRTDLSGAATFRDVLGRVRETCLAAYRHHAVPFEHVVKRLGVERDLRYNPLFQVMLVLESAPVGELSAVGLDVEVTPVHTGTAKMDLLFILFPETTGYEGVVEFDSDLFDAATVDGLAGRLCDLVAAAVADPDRPLANLTLQQLRS